MTEANTVVIPAPWSVCLVVTAAIVAAMIAAVFHAWYVLPIDLIICVGLVFRFGRPWARHCVTPIYDEAHSNGRPKPYVRMTVPWGKAG